jgi:FG-GAP-like repeat
MKSLYASVLLTLVLTACGGGGGGSVSSATTSSSQNLSTVAMYQNMDSTAQVFNTQVADLNGDGLEDMVVSGWAVEPVGSTLHPHGKIPVKILIQQPNGTLQDQTTSWLGTNNMIWGSQRIVIADFDDDGKPDIFLGGFQDSPAQGNTYCCTPEPSVMFWNDGTSFSRYDFTEPVWAHAVCVDDLYHTGNLDIIVDDVSDSYASIIYVNNGNRNFTTSHLSQPYISPGEACSVVHDSTTGNIAIISTDINYTQVTGYTAVINEFDSNMNYIQSVGLPGSEGAIGSHAIVNIIQIDINNDNLNDLVLTDSVTGQFVALINQGNFNFSNQTSTYFPNQPSGMEFPYYSRVMTVNGDKALYVPVGNVSGNMNVFGGLWLLNNGVFSQYEQTQLDNDIGSYTYPSLYKTSSGSYNLMLISEFGPGGFTMYTRPL